jgi:hypothetical protein
MALLTPSLRLALVVLGVAAGASTLNSMAYAQQSCADDLKRLSERRDTELNRINALVRANKGKAIDPRVFCAQSGGLNASETALIAYMEKNKDWCAIPDDAVAGLKANHVKSLGFAAKACSIAAQIKKQQAAGAAANNNAPQAQPLPAGPL